MNNKILNFLFLSVFVVITTGCGGGSSDSPKADPNRDSIQPLSELEKASCEFKANEGGIAPTLKPVAQMIKASFQKSVDESLISAVLTASATETVRFAKITQVDYFLVDSFSQKSCKMLDFIPGAGQSENTVFNGIQKDASKNSTILGVYFPPESKQFSGNNKSALILIRPDTTRWTLVHEYMHHLFSKEVQGTKPDTALKNELEQEATEFEKVYNNYKKSESNQDLFQMTKLIERIVGLRIELLKRYTLEEITIESYLLSNYILGKFKYVPAVEVRGAKDYIKSSAAGAREQNTSLTKLLGVSTQSLAAIIKENPELAEEAKLVESKTQARKTELSDLMSELSNVEMKNLYGMNTEVVDGITASHISHAGCAHSKDAESQSSAAIQKVLNDFQKISK